MALVLVQCFLEGWTRIASLLLQPCNQVHKFQLNLTLTGMSPRKQLISKMNRQIRRCRFQCLCRQACLFQSKVMGPSMRILWTIRRTCPLKGAQLASQAYIPKGEQLYYSYDICCVMEATCSVKLMNFWPVIIIFDLSLAPLTQNFKLLPLIPHSFSCNIGLTMLNYHWFVVC